MKCARCPHEVATKDTKRGVPRLPKGWKHMPKAEGNEVEALCKECLNKHWRLTAIILPVIGPEEIEWPALREQLKLAWAESTRAANWMATEMYIRDYRRTPEMEKPPAWKPPYLYPETAQFALEGRVRSGMERAIQGKYRGLRYEILWMGSSQPLCFRYPYPYSVTNQAWSLTWEEKKSPVVSVPFHGGRIKLRLASDGSYRRHLGNLRILAQGRGVKGDLSLYRKRVRDSDGRNGFSCNEPTRPVWRIMCKLVAYVPRKEAQENTAPRFFSLRTDKDCMLYGVLEDNPNPWIVNADQVRDWCYQHIRWLHRIADDQKHETRKPKRRRRRLLSEYRDRGRKHFDRLNTYISTLCCQIVGYAERSQVTLIKYDDREQKYLPKFPWEKLRSELERHCVDKNISFSSEREIASPLEPAGAGADAADGEGGDE